MAAMATTLLLLLLAAPAVYGATYAVGGASGWETGVDYAVWTSDKTFKVGDSLVFTYTPNHKVDEVSADDFSACRSTNPIKSNGGTTVTIELSEAGSRYFICPTSDHCANGMKLQVKVLDSTTPTTPATPSTPSSSPPSSTPSGSGSPATPTGSTTSPPTETDTSAPSTPSGAWSNGASVFAVFATLLLALMA